MNNIISFPTGVDLANEQSEDSTEFTLHGPAKCLDCKKEWVAVAPVGTNELDCESCGTHRGVWKGPMLPADEDTLIFICDCGGYHFVITSEGTLCVSCGVHQIFE